MRNINLKILSYNEASFKFLTVVYATVTPILQNAYKCTRYINMPQPI